MAINKLWTWIALVGTALAFWKRGPAASGPRPVAIPRIPTLPASQPRPIDTPRPGPGSGPGIGPTPPQPSGIEQILAGRAWQVPARNLVAYHKYAPYFDAATAKYGLPVQLLERLSWQESRYNPKAVSLVGALGIMQIMPKIHTSVNPLDPVASINYAGKWLKELYVQFGNWRFALAAYNAGPTAVRKYKGIPPYRETQDYVKEIANDIGLA